MGLGGKVKIQVDTGRSRRLLTYEIDAPVKVGDTVMIPAPFWFPHDPPLEAEVVELGSDYDGPLVRAWLPVTKEGEKADGRGNR
jgi:hypothetical protein